nr:hypothetical protein [Tanacetum cinerariifolium]
MYTSLKFSKVAVEFGGGSCGVDEVAAKVGQPWRLMKMVVVCGGKGGGGYGDEVMKMKVAAEVDGRWQEKWPESMVSDIGKVRRLISDEAQGCKGGGFRLSGVVTAAGDGDRWQWSSVEVLTGGCEGGQPLRLMKMVVVCGGKVMAGDDDGGVKGWRLLWLWQ